ncbi:MAG: YnbE family lipoprotein [bacterium]
MKLLLGAVTFGILFILTACGTVKVKHEVAPIFITVDVNIKVQQELNDFFDFEDEGQSEDENEQAQYN